MSDEIEQHISYTRSLNTIVSKLMTWYGSLVTPSKNISFQPIDNAWTMYRNQYPEDISQIKILKTDLQQSKNNDNHYSLSVETAMTHKSGDQVTQKYINEQFEFEITADDKPVINEISFKEKSTNKLEQTAKLSHTFDELDFKSREFAYAWLAYLDDAKTPQTTMNLSNADYAIKIGSITINKSFRQALKQRKRFLTRGGATLRAIEITKSTDKPDRYQLEMTMNWKGVNEKNKPVIAKIEQKIELEIQKGKVWKIFSIEEQHLLPDLTPWQDLLC